MKYHIFTVLLWLGAILLPALAESGQPPIPGSNQQCRIGPVSKAYGKRLWLVYSCEDNKSLVVVSAPGNPAFPFYFIFTPAGDGYQIHGDGKPVSAGSTEAVDTAASELLKLKPEEVKTLFEQTRQVK